LVVRTCRRGFLSDAATQLIGARFSPQFLHVTTDYSIMCTGSYRLIEGETTEFENRTHERGHAGLAEQARSRDGGHDGRVAVQFVGVLAVVVPLAADFSNGINNSRYHKKMSVSSRASCGRSTAASHQSGGGGNSYASMATSTSSSAAAAAASASSHRSHPPPPRRQRSIIGSEYQAFELACNCCGVSFAGIETVLLRCNCMLCRGA
jgi:hypothetical protein